MLLQPCAKCKTINDKLMSIFVRLMHCASILQSKVTCTALKIGYTCSEFYQYKDSKTFLF